MRVIAALSASMFFSCAGGASAQTNPPVQSPAGQQQPQGPTGPLNTRSGGAPASSPQGETPPGMQSNPQGSGGSTVERPGQTKK
jgi:hypothetical protein